MLKKINKIKEKYLFGNDYLGGLKELKKFEKKCGEKVYFLLCKGVFMDHLSMISKGPKSDFYENKAIEIYKTILKKAPKNIKAYYGLGRIDLHKKRFNEGLRWYIKALRLKPKSRFNKLSYAVALFWAKKYDKAEKILMDDYKNHGPSFMTVYNLFLLEKKLKKTKNKNFFAQEAFRLWKKKSKKIRESKLGRVWEKEIRGSD